MHTKNYKRKYEHFAFLFFLSAVAMASYGQQTSGDSALYVQITNNIISDYKNDMQGNLRLYNGRQYLYSGHNVKGFPYFQFAEMMNGSIFYDGNFYSNVLMYYDLVNDELVINDYTKNYPIRLITDKISYFTIADFKFINANDSLFSLPAKNGFYQELFNNKTIVLAKKLKQLKQTAKTEDNEAWYKEFNSYYIISKGKIYKVNNEREVLNVYRNRKNELKKFVHAANISFKKDFETALIKTAKYFDEIEN